MLTFFSNALRISRGACWMASVKASSSVLSNSVTSSFSNSCSAWSTVRVLRASGLDTISVICSLVIPSGMIGGNELSVVGASICGFCTCGCSDSFCGVVSSGRIISGTVVLERGTEGSVIDVGGEVVSSGGGTVSGGRVSVVRGISICGIGWIVVGGLVVSGNFTSCGCGNVPVGTATTGSCTG